MNLMKQHGRFQVELKHHYPLDLDRSNQFSLDVYILSPFSLDIQETTYKRPDILADTHIYTRYTIYDTTLEELLSRENRRSPLVRLEDMLKEILWIRKKRRGKSFMNSGFWQILSLI